MEYRMLRIDTGHFKMLRKKADENRRSIVEQLRIIIEQSCGSENEN